MDSLESQAGSHSKSRLRSSVARMSIRLAEFMQISTLFDLSAGDHLPALNPSNGSSPFLTPAFVSHSSDEHVVPITNGEKLCQGLKNLCMAVIWKEYENGGYLMTWVGFSKGTFKLTIDKWRYQMALSIIHVAGMGPSCSSKGNLHSNKYGTIYFTEIIFNSGHV